MTPGRTSLSEVVIKRSFQESRGDPRCRGAVSKHLDGWTSGFRASNNRIASYTARRRNRTTPRPSLKTPTLEKSNSTTGVAAVRNVLRTALSMRDVSLNARNEIFVRDVSQRVALAAQVVASLDRIR
jgi:hypothetical protein